MTKKVKTFLATWRPAGGLIRVVLVEEEHGWLPFFCTDPQATVGEILGAMADRWALDIPHLHYTSSERWYGDPDPDYNSCVSVA